STEPPFACTQYNDILDHFSAGPGSGLHTEPVTAPRVMSSQQGTSVTRPEAAAEACVGHDGLPCELDYESDGAGTGDTGCKSLSANIRVSRGAGRVVPATRASRGATWEASPTTGGATTCCGRE